jgi:hypothetical protein
MGLKPKETLTVLSLREAFSPVTIRQDRCATTLSPQVQVQVSNLLFGKVGIASIGKERRVRNDAASLMTPLRL